MKFWRQSVQERLRARVEARWLGLRTRWVAGHRPASAGTSAFLNDWCDRSARRSSRHRSGPMHRDEMLIGVLLVLWLPAGNPPACIGAGYAAMDALTRRIVGRIAARERPAAPPMEPTTA